MVGLEVVEVGIFRGKLFIAFLPDVILCLYARGGLHVETKIWEDRIFDKKEWHVGVGGTDYLVEGDEQSGYLFDACVGNAFENDQRRIGNGCYDAGDLEVELAVAAEAEVDDLTVEPACEYVGVGHAGPVGASALQQARAVEYDLPAGGREC